MWKIDAVTAVSDEILDPDTESSERKSVQILDLSHLLTRIARYHERNSFLLPKCNGIRGQNDLPWSASA